MNPYYPNLFSPIQMGNRILKNRYVTGPHNHSLNGGETAPVDSGITFYGNKAAGGAAVVNCASIEVDSRIYQGRARSALGVAYDLYDRVNFHYFRQQTEVIHSFGALAAMEICYFQYGGLSSGNMDNGTPYDVVARVAPNGKQVYEMPKEEMERIAKEFADLAENAVTVGFDMILIHGGHGQQLSRFMSPIDNKRTDEFGGCLENRARFPIMCLDAIRQRVGKKLLIDFRISADDYLPGGWDINETIAFTKLVQDRIDCIHISAGTTMANDAEHTRHTLEPAYNAELARQVKADPGVKIPVAVVGNLASDPELDEKLIAEGYCDIIVTTRQSIADPQTFTKAQHGHPEDIRPCLHCYNCFSNPFKSYFFGCTVNPEIGLEHRLAYLTKPVTEKKRVAVIGGGPAGMEAAFICANRGHDVTLYEKEDHLGGNIAFAYDVPFKSELAHFCTWLKTQVEKAGVRVLLSTEAEPDRIRAEGFDVVLCAVGAEPVIPPIPGLDGPNVVFGTKIHEDMSRIGQRVAIIGGGLVGCEEGMDLARRGHQVTVVEMTDRLASDDHNRHRNSLLTLLAAEENLTTVTEATCTAVTDTGIVYEKDGTSVTVEADTVILAAGLKPRAALREAFRDCAIDFVPLGDCDTAGNVKGAVHTAYHAAIKI